MTTRDILIILGKKYRKTCTFPNELAALNISKGRYVLEVDRHWHSGFEQEIYSNSRYADVIDWYRIVITRRGKGYEAKHSFLESLKLL
jgi:hypothetical protein